MTRWFGLTALAAGILAMPLVGSRGEGLRAADPVVQARYQQHCHACHGNGAADAPITHDARDWAARHDVAPEELVARARAGREGMPPMGGCYECSKEDLAAIIRYMSTPE